MPRILWTSMKQYNTESEALEIPFSLVQYSPYALWTLLRIMDTIKIRKVIKK